MRKSLAYTMAALLSATTASIALAQPAPGPGPGPQRRFENRPFSRPSERVEARLAYIKTALKITDAQQTQWNGFADAVRKNAKDMDQRMQAWRQQHGERRGAQRPNAIQRLERMQTFHADAVTRINDLLAAEKPLYATLSPEQKRVADVVLTPGGGRMHGRMQHGGFRRG